MNLLCSFLNLLIYSSIEELDAEGYDAVNVSGGYRAYLKLSLSRYMEKESEEKCREKTAEIERSIIKKYRKSIWRPFTKALNEYQLIQEGDRIAVCISGGKDSMLLAKLVQELKRHGKIPMVCILFSVPAGLRKTASAAAGAEAPNVMR